MSFNDLNLTKNDRFYLCILLIFTSILSYILIKFQMSGGMYSPDECLYLISAYKYAGLDYYNICDVNDLFFTPIISFTTSLLLRCGFDGHLSISVVTALFGIFSIFGVYILLKNRFNQLLSLTGSILFGSFSIFLLNFASGLIDIPGVSVSIWLMIFGICAIDRNSKYFYILFPLFVIGFFTRYTSVLTLPVIFLYYLIKKDFILLVYNAFYDKKLFKRKLINYFKSSEFKIIINSIFLSIILTILICKFTLFDYNAPLSFIDLSINTVNVSNFDVNSIDYNGSKLIYLFGLVRSYLFGFGRDFSVVLNNLILFIIFSGLFLKLISIFKHLDSFNSFKLENYTKYFNLALITVMIAAIILSLIEFKVFTNFLISEIFFLMALLIFFSLVSEFNINKDIQSLNLIMFAWFGVYFIFISLYPIKNYRYAIPFLPPIVYFVIYGVESILDSITFGWGNKAKLNSKKVDRVNDYIYPNWTKIVPIILILIFALSTFTYIGPWEIEKDPVDSIKFINDKGYIDDLVNVTEYIKETDPEYHSKTFASINHHERIIRLYLNTNLTFTSADYKLIDDVEVDYVIFNKDVNFKNYHEIYHCGDFYLYYHN